MTTEPLRTQSIRPPWWKEKIWQLSEFLKQNRVLAAIFRAVFAGAVGACFLPYVVNSSLEFFQVGEARMTMGVGFLFGLILSKNFGIKLICFLWVVAYLIFGLDLVELFPAHWLPTGVERP